MVPKRQLGREAVCRIAGIQVLPDSESTRLRI
jgi:hypothetical protein